MSGDRAGGSLDDSRLPALGARGEGWVVLQFLLIGLAGLAGLGGPRWPRVTRGPRVAAAVSLFLTGAALMAAGSRGLGRHLTPFPRPRAEADLRRDGVYGLVRHPIYGGAILTAWAWLLVSSPLALVSVALAAPFYEAKRRREEAWLVEQHPDYEDYRRQVPRRFIPFVW